MMGYQERLVGLEVPLKDLKSRRREDLKVGWHWLVEVNEQEMVNKERSTGSWAKASEGSSFRKSK